MIKLIAIDGFGNLMSSRSLLLQLCYEDLFRTLIRTISTLLIDYILNGKNLSRLNELSSAFQVVVSQVSGLKISNKINISN